MVVVGSPVPFPDASTHRPKTTVEGTPPNGGSSVQRPNSRVEDKILQHIADLDTYISRCDRLMTYPSEGLLNAKSTALLALATLRSGR